MADLNTLKTDAGSIRDASLQNENTAFRVGSWLVDLIEFLTNTTIEAVMTSIIPSVTADGIVLTINYQKADGTTFSNSITLPLADAEKAGLMSPAMVNKITSITSKNSTQDQQIQNLSTLVDQNLANIENVTNLANSNKDKITVLQSATSDNAAAIDALQKSAVANNEYIGTVEQHCNERQDNTDIKNKELENQIKSLQNVDENTLIRIDEMQIAIDSLSQRVKYLEDTFVPRPLD